MAQSTRLYFENNLDVPLYIILIASETDLELHVHDYELDGSVCIPANRTYNHHVTPAIKRFINESFDDNGNTKLDMDYWIIPHLRTMRAISVNDTSKEKGRVNREDGPVFSFYPVEH